MRRFIKYCRIQLIILEREVKTILFQIMSKGIKNKKCCETNKKDCCKLSKQPNQKQVTTLGNRTTNYYVIATDEIIQIYNTSDIEVILPKAFTNGGKELIISKISDNDFKINIVASGGGTIDGYNSNIYLNNYLEKIVLISNGMNIYYIIWFLIFAM